jgi:hypothetical protein
MLYEVRIVEPGGHVPKRFELSRESPLHESEMALLRDLFFVVRRVRGAQEEFGGAAEVRRMSAQPRRR